MKSYIIKVMEDKETSNYEIINYRLKSIEDTLGELKTLLVSVPRLNDKIVIIETEQKDQKEKIESLQNQVQDIMQKPIKKDAAKWQYILDFIFKLLVGAAVMYIFSTLGVKT